MAINTMNENAKNIEEEFGVKVVKGFIISEKLTAGELKPYDGQKAIIDDYMTDKYYGTLKLMNGDKPGDMAHFVIKDDDHYGDVDCNIREIYEEGDCESLAVIDGLYKGEGDGLDYLFIVE